ncbi:gliding-motility protein MglA [candidate division WOR-3 bacterium RBG_13_43_14]|uniref:Gliding-motility protein MglA n=1 Tax=candidate division WOR-3 bacterium RBG_13_43_14 TaxID=1802590 RepID=A0A1F4UAV9_UNCW3|nr:MAG: gliding-motility protein MglA [candidate division WOR-3 bacterium RBG_13_43_14]
MANLNYADKELNLKIVYYGTGLCGKTTNLRVMFSTISPERRGKMMSLATELDQTLFFDFLPVDLGTLKGWKLRHHLYTVPGQIYYNVSRRLVLKNVDGLVFVVDSQEERLDENIESYNNLIDNLKSYDLDLKDLPMVIQYNKRDLPNIMPISDLQLYLNREGYTYFESVAVKGIGVFDTLKSVCQKTLLRQAENLPQI